MRHCIHFFLFFATVLLAESVGVRPYEMDWAGRHEDEFPDAVVADFETEGWYGECAGGVTTVARSREQQLFGDYVLDYMLANCCGDFDVESIVAPELVRLYNSKPSGPEYLQTLRHFLDNDCHTTQTAEEMYLHRSTLIKRLDRIREIVDIESPERRLYLQICLHLPDIEQVLKNSTDVSI